MNSRWVYWHCLVIKICVYMFMYEGQSFVWWHRFRCQAYHQINECGPQPATHSLSFPSPGGRNTTKANKIMGTNNYWICLGQQQACLQVPSTSAVTTVHERWRHARSNCQLHVNIAGTHARTHRPRKGGGRRGEGGVCACAVCAVRCGLLSSELITWQTWSVKTPLACIFVP